MKRKSRKPHKSERIIPPFNGVSLVEWDDHIALTPTYACREFVGLGKIKASELNPKSWDYFSSIFLQSMGDKELWVVVRWERYEDGRERPTLMEFIGPDATEREARHAMKRMIDFCKMTKGELERLGRCFKQKKEDIAYVKNRFPDEQPSPREFERYDLYQARLKVLAGMLPKTVALMEQASASKDPKERKNLERQAVGAFFAELSHYWTEKEVKAWQRSNPIGTEWISEFTDVRRKPSRKLDGINHALVLNWLRKGYNLLTAEELSNAIFKATGHQVRTEALKKRRERLGLTTKRPTGPRPRS